MIRYVATEIPERLYRIPIEQYHTFIEAGGFEPDARVELIDGLLVEMSPRTKEHEQAIDWLLKWLAKSLDHDRFQHGAGRALTLGNSEPEPGLVVFRPSVRRPYHPGTAQLVVEVSVSSLHHDLVTKRCVYASAGVREYWVVDISGRRVVRHCQPAGERYRLVEELGAGATLMAVALELPAIELAELFAAAHA